MGGVRRVFPAEANLLNISRSNHRIPTRDDRGEISSRTTDERVLVLRNGVVDDFRPPDSTPGDMNEGGELLVSYLSEGEGYRIAVYSRGKLTDLNTLIDPEADLLLKSADDSDKQGQIVAHSCDRSGMFCYGSVLLSPVPVVAGPSAAVLLLAGLALVAGLRRRIARQAIRDIAVRHAA